MERFTHNAQAGLAESTLAMLHSVPTNRPVYLCPVFPVLHSTKTQTLFCDASPSRTNHLNKFINAGIAMMVLVAPTFLLFFISKPPINYDDLDEVQSLQCDQRVHACCVCILPEYV